MADETRKEEGIKPVGSSESPELDDQVLEDVAGGSQHPDDNNIYNINNSPA
jgi:hypothetical protein